MEEDSMDDSFPDLKELENKIGRKTPESLLIWMKDASRTPDCSERRDSVTVGDSFTDKIKHLKFEMACLRAADVRILRQLLAVHEGMEAVRWLLEERGPPASRSGSATGSQSSLADAAGSSPTATDDLGTTPPPPRPLRDRDEPAGKEAERERAFSAAGRSYFDVLTGDSAGGPGRTRQSPEPPPNSKDTWPGAGVGPPVGTGRGTTFGASGRNTEEEEEEQSAPTSGLLLGYDAQWSWVDSQDDVTFL